MKKKSWRAKQDREIAREAETQRQERVEELQQQRREALQRIKDAEQLIVIIERELEQVNPLTVHYTVNVESSSADDFGTQFWFVSDKGKRRRVHPRKPGGGTKYPQDLCADEINAWMRREGITHVFADTEDDETSPECIKRGKHTRAAFVAWWRQLEEDE